MKSAYSVLYYKSVHQMKNDNLNVQCTVYQEVFKGFFKDKNYQVLMIYALSNAMEEKKSPLMF